MFDVYCIPMNIIDIEPVRKFHSREEIKLYVSKVEKVLDLPEGILSTINEKTKKPCALYKDIRLADVRQAVAFHINQYSKTKHQSLGEQIGLKRVSFAWSLSKAKIFYENKDSRFLYYYNLIEKIAV